jgi:hypothetical protein
VDASRVKLGMELWIKVSRRIAIRMKRNWEQEGVGGQSRSGACPGVYMGKRGGSLTRE